MEKAEVIEILTSLRHRYRLKALDVFAAMLPTPYGNQRNKYDDVTDAIDEAIKSLVVKVEVEIRKAELERLDERMKLLEAVADKAEIFNKKKGHIGSRQSTS